MARIKVTGYLYTEEIDPSHVDEAHEMGLSAEGFDYWHNHLSVLDDLDFRLEA